MSYKNRDYLGATGAYSRILDALTKPTGGSWIGAHSARGSWALRRYRQASRRSFRALGQ